MNKEIIEGTLRLTNIIVRNEHDHSISNHSYGSHVSNYSPSSY